MFEGDVNLVQTIAPDGHQPLSNETLLTDPRAAHASNGFVFGKKLTDR